jgi:hypothetical protein
VGDWPCSAGEALEDEDVMGSRVLDPTLGGVGCGLCRSTFLLTSSICIVVLAGQKLADSLAPIVGTWGTLHVLHTSYSIL